MPYLKSLMIRNSHANSSQQAYVATRNRMALADMGYRINHASGNGSWPLLRRNPDARLVLDVSCKRTCGICNVLQVRRKSPRTVDHDRPYLDFVSAYVIGHSASFHGHLNRTWTNCFTSISLRYIYCLVDPYIRLLALHLAEVKHPTPLEHREKWSLQNSVWNRAPTSANGAKLPM